MAALALDTGETKHRLLNTVSLHVGRTVFKLELPVRQGKEKEAASNDTHFVFP